MLEGKCNFFSSLLCFFTMHPSVEEKSKTIEAPYSEKICVISGRNMLAGFVPINAQKNYPQPQFFRLPISLKRPTYKKQAPTLLKVRIGRMWVFRNQVTNLMCLLHQVSNFYLIQRNQNRFFVRKHANH